MKSTTKELKKFELERQIEIEAKAFTNLMLCSFIQSKCRKLTPRGRLLVPKGEVIMNIRSSSIFATDSWDSYCVAMKVLERADELIAHVRHKKSYGIECIELTDAGRFILQTVVTHSSAHSILAEIDADIAGKA